MFLLCIFFNGPIWVNEEYAFSKVGEMSQNLRLLGNSTSLVSIPVLLWCYVAGIAPGMVWANLCSRQLLSKPQR